ncbi:MAG: hypothetical protein RBU45_10135 [Myxococcota bacterium]|nr:hypothetical protein [Myxococcota bacterium]
MRATADVPLHAVRRPANATRCAASSRRTWSPVPSGRAPVRGPRTALLALLALLGGLLGACDDSPLARTPPPSWAHLTVPATAAGADRLAVVLVSDWTSGGVSVIDLATRQVAPLVTLAHADALARSLPGRLLLVNRLGQDNLQLLDGDWSTRWQVSVGAGSNPQDALLLPDGERLLVSRYAGDPLLLSLTDGQRLGELDLSAWHDEDGAAECGALARSGERVLLAYQGLRHYEVVEGAGGVLEVDPATSSLRRHPTVAANPYSPILPDPCAPDGFLVGMAGRFGALDGGLERLDATGQSRGLWYTEQELGGDLLGFAFARDGRFGHALVAVAGADAGHQSTWLVALGDCTHKQIQPLLRPTDWSLTWLATNDRDELYVADRTVDRPGIRVLDGSTGAELTAAPLPTGLPPFQVLFVP